MHSEDAAQTFYYADSYEFSLVGFGTIDVGPQGEVYFTGTSSISRSTDAMQAGPEVTVDLYHPLSYSDGLVSYTPVNDGFPNGMGLIGQPWVATDHSEGPTRGNVYILTLAVYQNRAQIIPTLMFRRSTDRGETWSIPVRVNDDPTEYLRYAWFPVMSVAPNGRIDVVWNDMRNSPPDGSWGPEFSELFYSYSTDAGETWSPNEPVSPPFNHFVGYPGASPKLGDYYTMVSDNLGVNVAYAATFNGEQDIWFLRIGPYDCNGNDIPDENDIANGTSMNCNGNDIPDECEHEPDMNGDGRVNLADYALLQTCFTGSGAGPVDVCCTRLDTNDDSAIDLDDYPTFDDALMK